MTNKLTWERAYNDDDRDQVADADRGFYQIGPEVGSAWSATYVNPHAAEDTVLGLAFPTEAAAKAACEAHQEGD